MSTVGYGLRPGNLTGIEKTGIEKTGIERFYCTPGLRTHLRSWCSSEQIILIRECIEEYIMEDWPPNVSHVLCIVGPTIEHRGKSYWVDGEWVHPHSGDVFKFRSNVRSKAIVSASNGDLRGDFGAGNRLQLQVV